MDFKSEVPLTVFMQFNKIKALANSVDEIEKAVCTSETLKLSVDRTKVSRVQPLDENRNVDEHTVYVVRTKITELFL